MSKPSLFWRLFVWLALLIVTTSIIMGAFGLRSARNKITENYDAQLITEANVLWQVTREDIHDKEFREYDIDGQAVRMKKEQKQAFEKYIQWRAFRIWKGGKLVIESDNVDDMPQHPAKMGFSEFKSQGQTWRVFSLYVAEDSVIVEALENLHNRVILQDNILWDILRSALMMLPILALLLFLGIRYGLTHLRILAQQLAQRTPHDLSHVSAANMPCELQPLVQALNSLLMKLENSLSAEREFIDHAAHELRTPLSTLKLQAQLIEKAFNNQTEKYLVQDLIKSVDRTGRLVGQLLLISRLSHQEIILGSVNLYQNIHDVIEAYAGYALDKGVAINFDGPKNLEVMAQAELLQTLLGTILDNSLKYTANEGTVEIKIMPNEKHIILSISDNGPGIPEDERAYIFDRFYRGRSVSEAGSGLGLSIAQHIAELFQARIDLITPVNAQGLCVNITFNLS